MAHLREPRVNDLVVDPEHKHIFEIFAHVRPQRFVRLEIDMAKPTVHGLVGFCCLVRSSNDCHAAFGKPLGEVLEVALFQVRRYVLDYIEAVSEIIRSTGNRARQYVVNGKSDLCIEDWVLRPIFERLRLEIDSMDRVPQPALRQQSEMHRHSRPPRLF